ncbi:MAG: FecR family protein [Cryomorphaceae bacterium]|nr:FecR domain-containing protein [Flavobacteriales bacterium]
MKKKITSDLDLYLSAERLPFKRTKEEAWNSVTARIETAPVIAFEAKRSFKVLKVAAVMVVLIAGAGFGVFFGGMTTVDNNSANALTVGLPDGSEAILNKASSVSYNEWLWSIQRKVALNGEAFFEVEKGSTFSVTADLGDVRVLGTSFNVRAESGMLEVQCKTGRVAVDLSNGEVYKLTPGKAVSSNTGKVELKDAPAAEIGLWTNAPYSFDDVSVKSVFDALSEDTGFEFEYKAEMTARYTGEFSRGQKIEDVLEIICKPVGLTFEIDRENNLITILNK